MRLSLLAVVCRNLNSVLSYLRQRNCRFVATEDVGVWGEPCVVVRPADPGAEEVA